MVSGDLEFYSEEPIFDPVECTIRVQPILLSHEVENYPGIGKTLMWECKFEVRVGNDSISMGRAEGTYIGVEREGTGWEYIKRLWKHQYDYLSRYLGEALLLAGDLLAQEAVNAETDNVSGKEWKKWMKALSEKLAEMHPVASALMQEVKDAEFGSPEYRAKLDEKHKKSRMIVLLRYFIVYISSRLEGHAYMSVGSAKRLRYSIKGIQKCINLYPAERKRWKDAKDILVEERRRQGRDDKWKERWRERVKAEIGELPDDLLDALAERDENRTSVWRIGQVALISAARQAEIRVSDDENNLLTMTQWRTLNREIKDFVNALSTAVDTKADL